MNKKGQKIVPSTAEKDHVMKHPGPNHVRVSTADATALMEANPHSFRVDDPCDIGDLLEQIAVSSNTLTIYSEGLADPIMVRIHSVDDENLSFIIELKEGSLLPSGQVTCVSSCGSAKLQFAITGPWATLPDRPTLMLASFPNECLVLERRSSPRLETPLGAYCTATFVLDGRPYELQLYDFSMGGVGMLARKREAPGLYVGRKLPRVRLEMGPNSAIVTDLEVRMTHSFRSSLVGAQLQIGCRFLKLTPQIQAELITLLATLKAGRKPRN
jgi:c-di-GMP-binding flagellar brake protein YcgR